MKREIRTYGTDPSQVGELFVPSGRGPFPVCVVIHGGYWRSQYDRSLMTGLCLDLAARGLAAWNIEYRRVGNGGGWPDTFHDVAAAVDLLAQLDAPLDLSAVSSVGHSAGGQLALWVAARPGLRGGMPGSAPLVVVRAAVSQAGVVDLRLAAELKPSAEPTRALLGDPDEHGLRYDIASPREHVPLGVPHLLLHGDRDDVVSMRIPMSYASAAREADDAYELRVLNGTGHYEHIDAGSLAWRAARDWLVAQSSAARS